MAIPQSNRMKVSWFEFPWLSQRMGMRLGGGRKPEHFTALVNAEPYRGAKLQELLSHGAKMPDCGILRALVSMLLARRSTTDSRDEET